MPTYDYCCSACGHRSERFESINDGALKACAKCGKKKAKRMLGTGAGLIFKGAGFYTTDSKRPPGGDSGGAPKEADSKAADPKAADPKAVPKEKKKEEKESKK